MSLNLIADPEGRSGILHTDRTIIIGTRGSKLALWQAEYIRSRLAGIGVRAELKIIKTQGDIIQHLRLDKLEGKGFFTKELEEELLRGDIDMAVHSHKDLPTQSPAGLVIAAVSEREDPSELLIVRKEHVDPAERFSLKKGALVGTSSNRRKAQLLALRPDLSFADLRGNVITRVEKLRSGNYDAIVLAKAGITRIELDLSDFYVKEIAPFELIPAPAQGVLAMQIRETDGELREILSAIHDAETAAEIGVERRVLELFEAGCHAPLGCYCRRREDGFEVWTSKADHADELPDRYYTFSRTSEGLAERIARQFSTDRKMPSRVFISREIESGSYFARAMAKHGVQVQGQSLIQVSALSLPGEGSARAGTGVPVGNASEVFRGLDWVFFTSKNSVEFFFRLQPVLDKTTKFAVIGRGSEAMLRRQGHEPHFSGEQYGIDMDGVAVAFARLADGCSVLIPRAQDTLGTMRNALTAATTAIDLPVYETKPAAEVSKIDAEVLIFTSPSNVRAYFERYTLEPGQQVICIGHASHRELAGFGWEGHLPATPDEIGLAEAVFGLDRLGAG